MSPLMDAFNITLAGDAAFKRSEEVAETVREKLAKDVERSLRTQGDLSVEAASTATVTVEATDLGLVIKSDNPIAIVNEVSRRARQGDEEEETETVDDLFTQSSGVPRVTRGADGTKITTFRTLRADNLFGEAVQATKDFRRNETIRRAVEDNIGQRIEEAYKEVGHLHKGDSYGGDE